MANGLQQATLPTGLHLVEEKCDDNNGVTTWKTSNGQTIRLEDITGENPEVLRKRVQCSSDLCDV